MNRLFELLKRVRKDVVVYYHNSSVPDAELPRETVNIDWMTEEVIERTIESEDRKEKFQYFLDIGYSGLLAHRNGSWIAYGWISKPEAADVPYQLPDWIADLDMFWLFYGRTKEQYRENGWHKYILTERLRAIYAYNPDAAIYTDAVADNVSRFSMLSTGFEPMGKITAYRFGYPLYYVKTVGCWNWEVSHPPLPNSE